jgi:hypothetical protein
MVNKGKGRENLRAVVNASGFAFQLAVEQRIVTATDQHGWLVDTHEHPWRDQEGEGFIDLVLEKPRTHMVLECKRLQDAAWVFLVPKERRQPQLRVKVRWTDSGPGLEDLTGWFDYNVSPESYESEFCSEYKGKKGPYTLESIAGELLRSAEALANELLEIDHRRYKPEDLQINYQRFFVPTIVTTAELVACYVDTHTVSLNDGTLGKHEFETVPWIRFRKSLTSELTEDAAPVKLKESHEDRVRTVIIVNAAYLVEFLAKWAPGDPPAFYRWPWELPRERERQRALTRGVMAHSKTSDT